MSTVPTNPPSNPVPGSVYVDIATNTAYVWTGNGWIPSGGSTGYRSQISTGAAILPGYFSEPTPESFVTAVGNEPTNPGEGQIWVDDSTTPSPAYVWHDNAWVKLTDGTFTDTTVASVPPASPDSGDSYYETATGRFYVWDGTAWKVIGEGDDTNSIYSMSTPALRPSGGALQSGDLWVNSVSSVLSYYNGSTWISISGGSTTTTNDTQSFAIETNGIPLITTRLDGTPLQNGDQVVDTGDSKLWYYEVGIGWKTLGYGSSSYLMSILANEGNPTSRPDGTSVDGDLVYDTNVPAGVPYHGMVYATASGGYYPIGAHVSTGGGVPDSFSGRPAASGGSSQEGDLYINTTTNDLYRYNYGTTSWVLMNSGTSSSTDYAGFFMSHLNPSRPNGTPFLNGDTIHDFSQEKNAETYIFIGDGIASSHAVVLEGAGAPTLTARGSGHALVENDFYIDETNADLYRWDSAAWQQLSSGGSVVADATQTVAGKIYGSTDTTLTNTALGYVAGSSTQTGANNVAIGTYSHSLNTTGVNNVAIGTNALSGTDTASHTIAIGAGALAGQGSQATVSDYNIAIGYNSLRNSVGARNIAIGREAGNTLASTATSNTLIGDSAASGMQGDFNTCIGVQSGANANGNYNIFIGEKSGTNVATSNTTIIGSYKASVTVPDGSFLLCKTGTSADVVHLRFNENSAHGVPTAANGNSITYGAAGQVLTSQGSSAPPQWTTPSSGNNIFTLIGSVVSASITSGAETLYLLDSSDIAVPINDPGSDASKDGASVSFIAKQSSNQITFSNQTGTFNFSGGGTSYVWTPSRVGETITLTYYKAFYDNGFGILVSIS